MTNMSDACSDNEANVNTLRVVGQWISICCHYLKVCKRVEFLFGCCLLLPFTAWRGSHSHCSRCSRRHLAENICEITSICSSCEHRRYIIEKMLHISVCYSCILEIKTDYYRGFITHCVVSVCTLVTCVVQTQEWTIKKSLNLVGLFPVWCTRQLYVQ